MAKPFTIAVPDERLALINAKVASFDWGALPDAGGWQSGVGLADLNGSWTIGAPGSTGVRRNVG